jgi:regulator of sirC expression with transglutaminase-like and TPR domain
MRTITKFKAPKPLYCHGEAYEYFLEQLPQLPTIEGLVRAAVAVSMHALEDVDPMRIEARLRALSDRVRQRARSQTDPAILANMHHVLFDEEGFCGNLQHYYNALNSYLPVVLDTHLGLPIVLSLIYKAVGQWSGLTVEGINAPGHFLVQVKCDQSWMIVDPFFGGQLLSRDEAFERLDRVVGRTLPRLDELLTTATHEQWLTRIIGNLRQLFANEGRRDDLAAMTELAHALDLAQNPA